MNDKEMLLEKIVKYVSGTIGIDENEVITDVNVQELGFGSIDLVSFVEKISLALGVDVHPGVFFEHSTLEEFANYLLINKTDAVKKMLSASNVNSGEQETVNAVDTSSGDPWTQFIAGSLQVGESESTDKDSTTEKMTLKSRPLPDNVPLIIGGGIGGMLISRQLSRKNIPHIVVGASQLGDSPKLGESMTEACTIEFTQDFKDYSQYFFPKNTTPFFMGDIVAGLRFDFFGAFASLFLDEDIPQTFIHVDRIGFDKALYEEVIQYDTCYWVDDLVVDVEYQAGSDTIGKVMLKNGTTLNPTFVWDCTNHIRLLGRKLNIPYKDFDALRQVIFTHYYEKDCQDLCDHDDIPWMHATTLLRADEKIDGLKGVSWFIPLGSYVSVGISMDPEDMGDRNPEEIIAALTKAYQRRGVDYSKYFTRRKEVVSVPSQHFIYDRFYGKNWAMVGGSAAAAWFTSGSNMSMLACMASMADKIIKEPEVYGEHYSRHVRGFAQTQKVYDNLLLSDLGPLDATKFLSSIIEQARKRISSYYMFRKGIDNNISEVATQLWQENVVIDKRYFDFLRQVATHAAPKDINDQCSAIFTKLNELKANVSDVKIPYLRDSTVRKAREELFI